MSFITDSQSDIQQFTPHQQQKSHAIEILEAIGVGVAVVGIAAAVIFAPEALPALVEAGEALEGAAAVEGAGAVTGEAAATSEYTLTRTTGYVLGRAARRRGSFADRLLLQSPAWRLLRAMRRDLFLSETEVVHRASHADYRPERCGRPLRPAPIARAATTWQISRPPYH
jgi:hypothetical protein